MIGTPEQHTLFSLRTPGSVTEEAPLIIISKQSMPALMAWGRKECIVSRESFIKTRAGARQLYNSSLNILGFFFSLS